MGFIITKLLRLYLLLISAKNSLQTCREYEMGANVIITESGTEDNICGKVLALSCHDITDEEHMTWDSVNSTVNYCRHNGIKKYPYDFTDDMTHWNCQDYCVYPELIEISRWNKKNIDEDSLRYLPRDFQYLVVKLIISSSKISNINSATFSSYTGLKEFNLDHNELSTLGRGVFSEQSALEYLDLSYNKLETIDGDLFLTDKKIKTIKFNNNKVSHLRNNLFYNLPSIEKIYLGNNNISSITSLIFKRQHLLTLLDLSGNSIKIIEQNSFENVANLEEIFLQNNQLNSIPKGLFFMQKNLKIVNLSNNPIISYLPLNQFIGNLGSLEILNLDNIFHSDLILENLKSTKNLTYLSVKNNNISKIPSNIFEKLGFLEHIDLSFNEINYVDNNAFGELVKLTSLKLNNNNIETLFSGAFMFLEELSELDLSYNKINYLPLGLLDSCSNLRILKLSHNRINHFSKLNFGLLKQLNILEIDNNALTRLEGISYLPNLQIISIENNSWNCLDLFDLIDKLEGKSVFITKVSFDPKIGHHIRHISCEYKEINIDLDKVTTDKSTDFSYKNLLKNISFLFDKFARNMSEIINNGKLAYELHNEQDNIENMSNFLKLPYTSTGNSDNVFNYIFLFIGLSLLVIVSVGVVFILYKLRNNNTKEYMLQGFSDPTL